MNLDNLKNTVSKHSKKIKSAKEKYDNSLKVAKFKFNIAEFKANYGKLVFSAFIIIALVIACISSVVERNAENDTSNGVMMSVSDTDGAGKRFAKNSFNVQIVSYNDMVEASAAATKEAEEAAIREQLDAVIIANSGDGSQSATLSKLSDEEIEQMNNPTTETATYSTEAVEYTGSTDYFSDDYISSVPSVALTDAGDVSGYQYLGEFLITAYCPCPICCGAYSNMTNPTTASGTTATAGRTIAVDTSVIPFGTKVAINGHIYTAEDRGSAIKGKHIDMFFATHEEATAWGKQYMSVYIIN